MQKLKIDRLIIVEGKYDKIRLSNIVDADIIAVNGFSIFNDKSLRATLKQLADKNGALILTDSDTAGYRIRVFLSQLLSNADVVNVLAPQIMGKEKRKSEPSAQGYVGIEGTNDEILYKLLSEYVADSEIRNDITTTDLYLVGLAGVSGARDKRNDLLKKLGVQQNISNKFLLRLINEKYSKKQFYDMYGLALKEENDDR